MIFFFKQYVEVLLKEQRKMFPYYYKYVQHFGYLALVFEEVFEDVSCLEECEKFFF